MRGSCGARPGENTSGRHERCGRGSSREERSTIKEHGQIEIFDSRPQLEKIVKQVISSFEGVDASAVGRDARKSWCMLYCGGSKKIEETLRRTATGCGIGWQSELFDW